MPTLMSPGVATVEKDFSNIVPSVSSSVGGMVIRATKGPIETPVLISTEEQLVSVFGAPTDANANDWFTVAEFLRYTNACWIVRSRNTGLLSANSNSASSISIVNRDEYESISSGNRTTAGEWISKNPGTVGNGIGVMMIDSGADSQHGWGTNATYPAGVYTSGTGFLGWCDDRIHASTPASPFFPNNTPLYAQFSGKPGTSSYVASKTTDTTTDKNDEVHILILDITGAISGTPYTVLEKYEGLSKAADAVNYQGLTTYYVNVINESSDYVWWSEAPQTVTTGSNIIPFGLTAFDVAPTGKSFAQISITSAPYFFTQTLGGGVTGTTSSLAEVKTAYDKLSNKDLYSVDLMLLGAFSVGNAGDIENYVMNNIVSVRKDCVGFISAHTTGSPIRDSAVTQQTIATFKTTMNIPDNIASYGFMDTGFKYIYDRYSKKYRWVPLNGDMAGLAARTDASNDPWWSFAGFNRGGVKNVIKLAYNPNQADRDYLYPKGINPVIIDPSSGPTLLGDRTMTTKPSAFDRVNVRRLFIVLEKAISKAAKYSMFEFNDAFTRASFKNMVEPFLKSVQGRRGLTDFMVQCDTTNNTGDVIDRNEFAASMFLKPAKSINFITLSFVATRSDVAFSTVVGA
jgi:hypothetical protein